MAHRGLNKEQMMRIDRHRVTTKAGNTLEFFYNPDNDLVVIDLISNKETGGKELLRVTLDEKAMLKHCPNEMPEEDI
jgi:hypothetical protein